MRPKKFECLSFKALVPLVATWNSTNEVKVVDEWGIRTSLQNGVPTQVDAPRPMNVYQVEMMGERDTKRTYSLKIKTNKKMS